MAIASNNIGVSLLQRGALREAYMSMRDAITLMKESFPLKASNSPQEQQQHQQASQLQQQQQQRQQYEDFMRSQDMYSKAVKTLAVSTQSASPLLVQGIAFSDADLRQAVIEVQRNGLCGSRVMHPIYIETLEDMNADVASAVLLYNYGLVHRCIGKANGNLDLMASALQTLRLARNLLMQTCSQVSEDHSAPTIICLSALIVTSSSQILVEEGEMDEAVYSFAKALHIFELMSEDELAYDAMDVAAAAA
jgi:tetratricopeptide (TPR) repeat protein